MDLGIAGKRALVTGASAGLGFATALALSREGVKVTINSRSESRLAEAAARIEKESGQRPAAVVADIALPQDVTRLTVSCGPVDILISNAGGPAQGFFEDHPPERWDEAARLTLNSAVNLTRSVLPGMVQRKWGRLVYITSVAVLQPIDDLILSNTYRAGVTGFCKTIANTYAVHGITANCVCPGYTATERLGELAEKRAAKSGQSPQAILDGIAQTVPAKRLGKPEELAALVAFLCGQPAAYMTGLSIAVDGGAHRFII